MKKKRIGKLCDHEVQNRDICRLCGNLEATRWGPRAKEVGTARCRSEVDCVSPQQETVH